MTDHTDPSPFVKNAGSLTSHFGHWPCFHDAELVRLELTRAQGTPKLTMDFYTFQMLSETDEQGRYRPAKKCVVTFLFTGLDEFRLDEFNGQNVIFGLDFDLCPDGIHVTGHPCYGASFTFVCREVEVLRVEPLP